MVAIDTRLSVNLHKVALLRNQRDVGYPSVLDAAHESGLSGPSRLHDLFLAHESVTPGEFKQRGAGLTIAHAFHDSPFGRALIAVSDRGVCWLGFRTLAWIF